MSEKISLDSSEYINQSCNAKETYFFVLGKGRKVKTVIQIH